MNIFENILLRPAESYQYGDVTTLLPFKLAAKNKITVNEASDILRRELLNKDVNNFSIERGYLNFRIREVSDNCFLPNVFCDSQKLLSIGEIGAKLILNLEDYAKKFNYDETRYNDAEKKNLIFYLSMLTMTDEPDLWVPKFNEAANLRWYLYETVRRLKRKVISAEDKSLFIEEPHRYYRWCIAMLGARAYRAAVFGEVFQFSSHLKATLDETNRLLLNRREDEILNILSSALSILSNIITLVDLELRV